MDPARWTTPKNRDSAWTNSVCMIGVASLVSTIICYGSNLNMNAYADHDKPMHASVAAPRRHTRLLDSVCAGLSMRMFLALRIAHRFVLYEYASYKPTQKMVHMFRYSTKHLRAFDFLPWLRRVFRFEHVLYIVTYTRYVVHAHCKIARDTCAFPPCRLPSIIFLLGFH